MNKYTKLARNDMFIQMLEQYKQKHVCAYRKFTGSHFRVWTPDNTIDFFLTGMRWHNIQTNERGDLFNLNDFELLLI